MHIVKGQRTSYITSINLITIQLISLHQTSCKRSHPIHLEGQLKVSAWAIQI